MVVGIVGVFMVIVIGIMCVYVIFGFFGYKFKVKFKDIIKEKIVFLEGILGIVNGENLRDLENKFLNYIVFGEFKKF